MQRRVGGQPGSLLGRAVEQIEPDAEQPGGGVVAAGDHGEREAQDPQRVDPGAVAGLDQVRDGVVAGIGAAPLDQRGEVLVDLGHACPTRRATSPVARCGDDAVHPAVEADAVCFGHAEVVGDDEASAAASAGRQRCRRRRCCAARSMRSTANARIAGSISATWRGVKPRATRRRNSVWSGGSRNTIGRTASRPGGGDVVVEEGQSLRRREASRCRARRRTRRETATAPSSRRRRRGAPGRGPADRGTSGTGRAILRRCAARSRCLGCRARCRSR